MKHEINTKYLRLGIYLHNGKIDRFRDPTIYSLNDNNNDINIDVAYSELIYSIIC